MANQEIPDTAPEESSNPPVPVDKGRERLKVSSGLVLVIDQFMLSNKQFLAQIKSPSDADSAQEVGLVEAAAMFGGCALEIEKGTYKVFRDPVQNIIALERMGETPAEKEDEEAESPGFDFEPILNAKGNLTPVSHVFIDTRCLVFIDADFLVDQSSMAEYGKLRHERQDKQARDLLRKNGGAVRYGFNRYGDELGVFRLHDEGLLALWPDVMD